MPYTNYRLMIFIIICISFFCIVSCYDTEKIDENHKVIPNQYGSVYRAALHNEPISLDPARVRSTYAVVVLNQLFDGLVQFDADLNIIPSIAKSWKASPDGLLWLFKLRKGVRFHHGREVTAEDFVYSFTRIIDPKTESKRTWLFERVKGAQAFLAGETSQIDGLRALDKYTLQIELAVPYAAFIRLLAVAQAGVVPREEIERLGHGFSRSPVGTGPFRFSGWEERKEIVLEANLDYFEGRPFLDRIKYRIFPGGDKKAILEVFEQGALEGAKMLDQERNRLIKDTRYRLYRKPLLATLFLLFDLREGPLTDIKVRQAINLAINRKYINTTIRHNRFVQARGVLPPGMPGYNPELPVYRYDPKRARQLLAEAGYPRGKGLPPLQLWSSVKSSNALAEHDAIQADLKSIGITLELKRAQSWKQFQNDILGKRVNAFYRYAWFADFPDADNFLFVLLHTLSNYNYSHYSNLEVDRLLEKARSEGAYLERLSLYRQAEQLIVNDVPGVNLVHYTLEKLFQPYVRGVELSALGEPYMQMKKIWLDATHPDFSKGTSSN